MSERSISVISCIEVIAYCWLLALLLALGVFVVFVGNIAAGWVADFAIFAMLWITVILATNIIILRGLIRFESWAWYAAVLFLLLHLMGLLAPIALFGLWNIFRLDVQSDFGLARSPVDDDPHLNELGP